MEKTGKSAGYARRLYDDVLGWYRSADTKAQVVLGINSAFVAFLASGIFKNPGDLKQIKAAFTPLTWLLLSAMVVSLLASIFAAIVCLRLRTYSRADLSKTLQEAEKAGSYDSKVMWFFQFVADLKMGPFLRGLEQAGDEFEIKVMASQIHVLSGNVRKKHRAANVGFLFAAVTLSLFLLAGISYVVSIR